MPTVLPQQIALLFTIACFATFALTLLSVSITVTRAQRAAARPVARSVTPARQTETAAATGA
jgi:hypothetical protein